MIEILISYLDDTMAQIMPTVSQSTTDDEVSHKDRSIETFTGISI
jgi:hypothetical protein